MFDKLEALIARFEEIMNELNEPTVTENQRKRLSSLFIGFLMNKIPYE